MMKLHVFNPDHDVALACDTDAFTAPHAARELRADLSYLPALWADDGDMVLVDDVASALESVRHLGRFAHDVLFISHVDLARVMSQLSRLCRGAGTGRCATVWCLPTRRSGIPCPRPCSWKACAG